jgi:hypothetical protein
MSENSIDVDVNFHFGEINELFNKIIEGADIDVLKEISDKDSLIQGSLLGDITSVDDKTKLLETMSELKITAPYIHEVYKMIEEMTSDQGEQGDIIERTQRSMISLLTISKTMLRMFEEKFPITKEMQKELDNMSDALSDQSKTIEQRIEVVGRGIINAFAPIKEDLPRAFKITAPQADYSMLASAFGQDDSARAQIAMMMDFIKQVNTHIEEIIKIKRPVMKGGIREEELLNVKRIGEELLPVMEQLEAKTKEVFGEVLTIKTDTLAKESDLRKLFTDQPTVKSLFTTMETAIKDILNIMKELEKDVKDNMVNLDKLMAERVEILGKQEVSIAEVVGILRDEIRDNKKSMTDIKKTFTREIEKFKNVLSEDYYQGTIRDVLKQLIETEFVQPIATTQTARKLTFLLRLAENALGSMEEDLSRLLKGKTPEQIKEMGLERTVLSAKLLSETVMPRTKHITGAKDWVIPEFKDRPDLTFDDMTEVRQRLDQIVSRNTAREGTENQLITDFGILKDAITEIVSETKEFNENAVLWDNKIDELVKHTNVSRDNIQSATGKLNNLINKLDREGVSKKDD